MQARHKALPCPSCLKPWAGQVAAGSFQASYQLGTWSLAWQQIGSRRTLARSQQILGGLPRCNLQQQITRQRLTEIYIGAVLTPDPDASAKVSQYKREVYVIQMGGVHTTSKAEKALFLQEYYDTNAFEVLRSGVDVTLLKGTNIHLCVFLPAQICVFVWRRSAPLEYTFLG